MKECDFVQPTKILKLSGKVSAVLLSIALLLTANILVYSKQPKVVTAITGGDSKIGNYQVRMLQITPPKFAVTADLPINGKELKMERTRPGGIPEVSEKGWTFIIRNLRVTDAAGQSVEVKSMNTGGWELSETKIGRLKIAYEVDYSVLAENGFPAVREAAFADANHFSTVGRPLFITTGELSSSRVTFTLLPGWRAVAPWTSVAKSKNSFTAASAKDLTENLIVLSRTNTEVITAGGFRLFITATGHWQPVREEIKQTLQKSVPIFVRLMGFKENVNYSVVLLPTLDNGGESYRSSFAFTVETPPTRANRVAWGQTIGHEIFHYWNGWRLRGADYASSQWFQEGFTQYIADVAMVASGLISEDEFKQKLFEHINNYRKLTTPLAAPGSQKGPPLYSGGALVAFCWDMEIRRTSGGKRNLGNFMSRLWQQTNNGQRAYEQSDIQAALNNTASLDWEAFYRAHIEGKEKLPLEKTFSRAGFQLRETSDGFSRIETFLEASPSAKSLWQALIKGK